MPASLASQLEAIKSAVKGVAETSKSGPATRPSIIFDPKEAADIDLATILPIAISGLEVLTDLDARFRRYSDTLFSLTSLGVDREKMTPKENDGLNSSIQSYLRLLSSHLQLPAALKTLEYLIRRYQVHVFNVHELVLFSLPYHDTHTFVRIIQLTDLRKKQWAFLEGVKTSGAPPPRRVIVQQCIRDKGVLEDLCKYASPTKDFHHSRLVVCFCTAVVVEALGSVPKLDTDMVNRVVGFVFDGLNPSLSGIHDHKAGALMVVGLLATRATLAPKLVQKFVFFIARVAQSDAKQHIDLPWLRVTIMAIISLIQSQSVETFPKKTMLILNEIRDFVGVLSGLSEEFNIQKFLRLYLENLVDYSISDDSCRLTLARAVKSLPLKDFVEKIVSKVLAYCIKLSRSMDDTKLHEAGKWAKQNFILINEHYPCELRGAIHKFLKNTKMDFGDDESIFQTFCLAFDGSLGMPMEISDSQVWFSLEHPKAAVRQSTLTRIAASGVLKDMTASPKKFINIEDALVRRLHDEDLSVVQAALSIDGLAGMISPPLLLRSYSDMLCRCIEIINRGTTEVSKASSIAITCLERMVLEFKSHHLINPEEVASTIFPLLLVLPKTWKVNLKAIELAKHVQWPINYNSSLAYDQICPEKMKSLNSGYISSINMKTIGSLSEAFLKNPREHIQWLVECSKHNKLSKSLFFFIILHALIQNEEPGNLLNLYQASAGALKLEWERMESQDCVILAEEVSTATLDISCTAMVEQLLGADLESLNTKILIFIYWCLLKRYMETANRNTLADDTSGPMLHELFLFFVQSPSKNVFRTHLDFLVRNCSKSPFQFLAKYFAEEGFPHEVQVESLRLFAAFCSTFPISESSSINDNCHLQLLLGFPSLLVPLSNEDKDIRVAGVSCIEGLHQLWRQLDISRLKNGNETMLFRCVSKPSFGDFLESIFSQKKLISSDVNFLPSYLGSVLSSASPGLSVPRNSDKRFDQPVKEAILHFILSSVLNFSSYGKLKVLSLLKGTGSIALVKGVGSLLVELLEKRNQHHSQLDKLHQELSMVEINILCLLLEVCALGLNCGHVDDDILSYLIEALKVDGSSDDPAVVLPCVTVLRNLTCEFYANQKSEIQDQIFCKLVSLFRNENGNIRNAAKDALQRFNISCSSIVRLLELILNQDSQTGSIKKMKKKKVHPQNFGLSNDPFNGEDTRLSLLGSLLDIILLKKHIEKRVSLVQSLFQLLEKLFSNDWILRLDRENGRNDLSEIPDSVTNAVYYAQQTTLLILKDISDSFSLELPQKDDIYNKFNMNLLVDCARSAKDVATCNNVFMLLSSIARVSSGWLSDHIVDIFTLIGEAAVKQSDSHSQRVLEDLISTLVPCWLSKADDIGKLFQIFISALPEIAEHRRLALIVYLLRTLEEKCSLGILVFHLFRSLRRRINKLLPEHGHELLPFSSTIQREWEYMFAVQLFSHYSCKVWFPSLVNLLQEIGFHSEGEEVLSELHLSMQFLLQKLQDTELIFELESGQDADYLQVTLGVLMEQVVLQLQFVSVRCKQPGITTDVVKGLKECVNRVLKTITGWMVPSTYFKSIAQLLGHADENVKKKTLGLLCETVKDQGSVQKKHKEAKRLKLKSSAFHIDGCATQSFNELCLNIIQIIDTPLEDSEAPAKLPAISSLEVLTKEFPSDNVIFATCLTCIVKHMRSTNLAISSCCIRTAGALINVLGLKALSQLPHVMKNMLERFHEISKCPIGKSIHRNKEKLDGLPSNRVSLLLSSLITLEAVAENLGGFLNPYLDDILDLMILHPDYTLEVDMKLKLKAATVRRLLTQKIPVRLMLMPLVKVYSSALKCGESSLSLVFEMLADMIGAMDKSSIGSYHVKIFEQCLVALDLRRQFPDMVHINMVEQIVIRTMIVLTMKLTETMFRPLFFHSLEWAESPVEGTESRSLDRTISFYELVNKLIEQHRSLFVPYFKYLLESCTRYLNADENADSVSSTKKRKKTKVGEIGAKHKFVLSPKQWHLRAVILKSLFHCFLYDTADLKFLDASHFQVLLKPIVSQLAVEPPASLNDDTVPSVEEVDVSLVSCLGQMAITAGSDVLWKPLNHEVLMQTRSERVRARILGLKVVKYMVEQLKEEYLVLLPETIPFLGELLEDVELPVKTLVQEIIKEMEALSGESLRQYL